MKKITISKHHQPPKSMPAIPMPNSGTTHNQSCPYTSLPTGETMDAQTKQCPTPPLLV